MGVQDIWAVLKDVPDPEIPAVSVLDLGIVRSVDEQKVVITPTYSGCPATLFIEQSIREALDAAGYREVAIETRLAPAWTTDWISDEGRRKLREYGIAPPGPVPADGAVPIRFLRRTPMQPIACPRCESTNTERLSAFGATACKALYRCLACREPFEHFKPL